MCGKDFLEERSIFFRKILSLIFRIVNDQMVNTDNKNQTDVSSVL